MFRSALIRLIRPIRVQEIPYCPGHFSFTIIQNITRLGLVYRLYI